MTTSGRIRKSSFALIGMIPRLGNYAFAYTTMHSVFFGEFTTKQVVGGCNHDILQLELQGSAALHDGGKVLSEEYFHQAAQLEHLRNLAFGELQEGK